MRRKQQGRTGKTYWKVTSLIFVILMFVSVVANVFVVHPYLINVLTREICVSGSIVSRKSNRRDIPNYQCESRATGRMIDVPTDVQVAACCPVFLVIGGLAIFMIACEIVGRLIFNSTKTNRA
jgi:hypothetical protein